MNTILSLLILIGAVAVPQAFACDKLNVLITGNLSADALSVYATTADSLRAEDAPTINIPLDDINASDTLLSLRFTRADANTWRLDIYNDLKSDSPITGGDYQGPVSTILFDSEGRQSRASGN